MPLWQPSPERAAASQLAAFHRLAAERFRVADGYPALHAWSVREPDEFWPLLWDYLGIVGERGERVLERGASLADARFFPDAKLSFAENLLAHGGDAIAIIAHGADGSRRTLSRAELARETARFAAGLRDLGVAPGDRVVGILPNTPEAVIAMLAANSVGAIWSICDLDLGADAIIDRFGQIEPVVAIAQPSRKLSAMMERLPTVRHVVTDLAGFGRAADLVFERVPFGAPAFVLYTSGTTGLPKCIVHNTGGQLIQLLKEHRLHYDVRRDDRFFYQTSTGWNMWYWVTIALASGATIAIRDGSPLRPTIASLFDLADAERLTHLGVSPAYLAQARAAGIKPRESHALADLRAVMSTGSPLSPHLFDYVYDDVKPDVALISLSGGTEINACFATGDPTGAVHRGELQVPALGMDVHVFDDDGHVIEHEKGELVCTSPFPSQPVGFWNDPDRRRYLATYFERFPGAWHHGDFAETTPHGGLVIHGRSDSVLKPAGHRIGTAEIYRQLEPIAAIADSVAVAQTWHDDVRIVLFVKLAPGATYDDALDKQIRTTILRNTSPHHVPARIVPIAEIPYTKTGKKAELAVRQMIHGETVANTGALANPDALACYRSLTALAR